MEALFSKFTARRRYRFLLSALAFAAFACALIILAFSDFGHKTVDHEYAKHDWYESFYLSNGMRVIVIPNDKVPAVSHMLWYMVGGQDEPAGKSGIAHFLEHLMFKGTDNFPAGKFSEVVAHNGGKENAFTGQDFTAYYQKIAVEKLPLVMEMEADRMKNLVLSEDQVETERKVIIEERKTRVSNSPRSMLLEQMDAALYQNHPYGIPLIGWEHEMEGLDRLDALAFYKKYYNPSNAILIVAGDITADKLLPLAEKYYGTIRAGDKAKKKWVSEPQAVAERRIVLKDARVKEPELWQSYLAPSYGDEGDMRAAFAASVLSRVLGEGTTSILYQELVKERGIATKAGSQYSGLRRGPGEVNIYALPAEGVSLDDLEEEIDEEIEKIIAGEIDERHIESAKKAMAAELIYSREGLQSRAYMVGQVIAAGHEPDFIDIWQADIEKVTKDDLVAVASKVFGNKRKVAGELRGEEAE